MLPATVAAHLRESILAYVRTSLNIGDAEARGALEAFLQGDDGLFRGPYYELGLPFRKAADSEAPSLDVMPEFTPYRHQVRAFERLSSRQGRSPQSTLVVTGTGSGKTECFLYPILDHCHRHQNEPGVQAILLYPMNALASDQARRIAGTIAEHGMLKGSNVRAGIYVGTNGTRRQMSEDALIDMREEMRANPPQILLTNYRMLDLLLYRNKDSQLWRYNTPHTLRYLVLDELHTYDGAQGSDVACLIRRLTHRLACAPHYPTPVGTSATIGDKSAADTTRTLVEFAQKLFGTEAIDDASVITEERVDRDAYLGDERSLFAVPSQSDVAALREAPDPEAYLRAAATGWLVEPGDGERGVDADAALALIEEPVELGNALRRHDVVHRLIRLCSGHLKSEDEILRALTRVVPELALLRDGDEFDGSDDAAENAADAARIALQALFALISHARSLDGSRRIPFVTLRVQLWLRELTRLLRSVHGPLRFKWFENLPADETKEWAHMARCRECGLFGLAAFEEEGTNQLTVGVREVGRRWLAHQPGCRFVVPDQHDPRPDAGLPEYLEPDSLTRSFEARRGETSNIPVWISGDRKEDLRKNKKGPRTWRGNCPRCQGEDALGIVGARAASLISVAATHTMGTPYNEEPKLLTFVDSVQDASHRAGFIGARTWRFTLRTVMQSAIANAGGELPLSELGRAMVDLGRAELGSQKRFIAAFTPQDLRESHQYRTFAEQEGEGNHRWLLERIRERLRLEAWLELGLASRSGQTLEVVGAAAAHIVPERLDAAVARIQLWLEEELPFGPTYGLSEDAIRVFVEGLVHRTRMRGGIYDPQMSPYIQNLGNTFLLSRGRSPFLPPWPYGYRPPRYLINRARSDVFDIVPGKASGATWHRDWAQRLLGVDPASPGTTDLLTRTLYALADAEVFQLHQQKQASHIFSIRPDALLISTDVVALRADDGTTVQHVARAEAERWVGAPLPMYRSEERWASAGAAERSYYRDLYERAHFRRLFTAAHTGLLDKEEREQLEAAFQEPDPPLGPNVVVATPTLEMGIDIGDLSATFLASVPPSTASYLQRIGRAGRKTGNALVFTLATSRPHDQYFMAQPEAMAAGDVIPPGCYLDAPEMLKRQLTAFALDTWTASAGPAARIPAQIRDVASSEFPGNFQAFVEDRTRELKREFRRLFLKDDVSNETFERLDTWVDAGGIAGAVQSALDSVHEELKELKNEKRRVGKQVEELRARKHLGDEEKADLEELKSENLALGGRIRDKSKESTLSELTNRGALPNFAFPEPGVKLRTRVYQRRMGDEKPPSTQREYMRPAGTAIRELAPFNTFYADGYLFEVTELDLGTKHLPHVDDWRFCEACPHAERVSVPDKPAPACPRCGSTSWPDTGRVHKLVRFRGVRSAANALSQATVDDRDDRKQAQYRLEVLVDRDAKDVGGNAHAIAEKHFGFELVERAHIRQVNFGVPREGGHVRQVAHTSVPEEGFVACKECGAVKHPYKNEIQHVTWCPVRRKGAQEQTNNVWLLREMTSETLLVLLPTADLSEKSVERASMKAALALGLRRRLRGNPQHLRIEDMSLPVRDGNGRQHYVAIIDQVPGGTGTLASLAQPSAFRELLQLAHDHAASCVCARDNEQDGCYRCVYAYQDQYALEHISRRTAVNRLRDILDSWGELKPKATLQDIPQDSLLESELEELFVQKLAAHVRSMGGTWTEDLAGGRATFRMQVHGRTWVLTPQVNLGPEHGVLEAHRPDFVLRLRDETGPEVVIYCDGVAFHLCPGKDPHRIDKDVRQRAAVLASGRLVWSIGWEDLAEEIPTNASKDRLPKQHAVWQAILPRFEFDTSGWGSAAHAWNDLKRYLEKPDPYHWRAATFIDWFTRLDAAARVQEAVAASLHVGVRQASTPPDDFTVSTTGVHFVGYSCVNGLTVLLTMPVDTLRPGTPPHELLTRLRAVVRFDDQAESRASADAVGTWRALLHIMNRLQFLADATLVTDTLIDHEGALEYAFGQDIKQGNAWAELFELLDEDTPPCLHQLQHHPVSKPETLADFEDVDGGYGWAEVVWRQERVCISREAETYPGWLVLPFDVSVDHVLEALSQRETT